MTLLVCANAGTNRIISIEISKQLDGWYDLISKLIQPARTYEVCLRNLGLCIPIRELFMSVLTFKLRGTISDFFLQKVTIKFVNFFLS